MKKIILFLGLLLLGIHAYACPACEKQQPKILRGITHGSGPQGDSDYIIVWSAVIIVLATLFLSIKWIFKPGEKSEKHIKRLILNNE